MAATLSLCLAVPAQVQEPAIGQEYIVLDRIAYGLAILVAKDRMVEHRPLSDPEEGRTFRNHVDVLAQKGESYVRRFSVHYQGDDMEPLARRVGRALGMLWAMCDQRLGSLNARLRMAPLDVWLCRDQGGGAAQQTRRNLYIYDATADRGGLEWIRMLAHELGHFVLPGPSGYTEPESWANGILGERLFLSWFRDDIAAGTLSRESLPFGTPSEIEDYCAKQPDALVNRLLSKGPNRELIRAASKRGMDEATALLLYACRVHAPTTLQELLVYLPSRASREPSGTDFLAAYERWVGAQARPSYRLSSDGPQWIYVPAGQWCVEVQARGKRYVVAEPALQRLDDGSQVWNVRTARWLPVTIRGDAADVPVTLLLSKR